MSGALTVEPLPWDSEFFGIPIGKIVLDGADPDSIRAAEGDARAQGLVCLYWTLDPTVDAPLTFTVQTLGWRFVDAATSFQLKTSEPPIPRPEGFEFRIGVPDDADQLAHIVALLARWGRFAVDPRFGLEASRRLQEAWLARALDPTATNRSLLVAEEEGEIAAFVGRIHEPRPFIDTAGTTRRGSGAARHLMEVAREWAGDRPLYAGTAATRNIPVFRYVENCGYRVCEVTYQYHRWLDDPLT